MVENSTVLDWLSTLPPTPSAGPRPGQPALDEKRSRKRKRSSVSRSPHRLPSPPFSLLHKLSASCTRVPMLDATDLDPESDHDQGAMNPQRADASATTNTPTRNLVQRLPPNPDATDSDLEPTPRPLRADLSLSLVARQMAQSDTSSVASSSAASQTSFQTSSSTSKKRRRQSSPRKHTNLMAIENSIDYISFDGPIAPPPALYRLLNRIETLGRGVGIVSHTQEASVRSEASTNHQFRWVRDDTFAPDPATTPTSKSPSLPHRDELGPTPSVDTVQEIWFEAFDAETVRHEEGQWNTAIHRPLLHSALKHIQRIGVCNCTSAQIHSTYTRSDKSAHHNKKVDFCVYVNELSPELDAAILASPAESINHTDYPGLLRRPIGLSIETKITGHEWAKAVNQIAVWLIAQWDILDDLAGLFGHSRATSRASPAAAAGLSFLPAIIVQGHEWWFMAVTRKPDGATEFWSKTLIGSTTTTQGIYQISAVLQLLGRWIENEYWPWFQAAILKRA